MILNIPNRKRRVAIKTPSTVRVEIEPATQFSNFLPFLEVDMSEDLAIFSAKWIRAQIREIAIYDFKSSNFIYH